MGMVAEKSALHPTLNDLPSSQGHTCVAKNLLSDPKIGLLVNIMIGRAVSRSNMQYLQSLRHQ